MVRAVAQPVSAGAERIGLYKIFFQKFSYDSFQVRNEWMVNHAARVIAVYNGTGGGTHNTIEYAKTQGVPLRFISA